jgi:hypothetical protein
LRLFGKISVVILIALFASGSIFGQYTQQSRLDVGKNAKKGISNNSFFNNIPNKLNFNSKAEYTQFYRDLLLNNSGTTKPKQIETVAAEVKAPTKAPENNLEKIKFGSIFPNPADTYANLEYEIKEDFKDGKVTVMNMVGTSVLEYAIASNTNNSKFNLKMNTSGLASGIYMVQCVVDGKKMSTKKLLVERN